MEKCKTKTIQADVGISKHILAYSDIFKHKQAYLQAYSELYVTQYIHNSGIFRTLWNIYDGAFSGI